MPDKDIRIKEIAINILWKLRSKGKWGGSYISIDSLTCLFPSHERKNAKLAVQFLINNSYLIPYKQRAKRGDAEVVSLNPSKKEHIEQIIELYKVNGEVLF
ncbi:MAG: hypothetical protein KJ767_03425 [Nanoarchaeota archaeon]|nr:hypothetical protein [Nanoarchaeota archaeon]